MNSLEKIFSVLDLFFSTAPAADTTNIAKNRSAIDVKPSSNPYYIERGWVFKNGPYEGYYRCKYGAWKGLITKGISMPLKFYIFDPPEEVLRGSHRACFSTLDGYRYHVHFSVDLQSVDGGIMAIEKCIRESIEECRRR